MRRSNHSETTPKAKQIYPVCLKTASLTQRNPAFAHAGMCVCARVCVYARVYGRMRAVEKKLILGLFPPCGETAGILFENFGFYFIFLPQSKNTYNFFMKKIFVFSLVLIALSLLFSCEKENFITDSGAKLKFSTDTVQFDTIFTRAGSATRQLMVYNPHDKPIKISSVRLARNNRYFRMNIDGIPAEQASDIEIKAKDSLYIFVEVTIDPTQQNEPLVVHDSIVFQTNGNQQDVDLVAYGQDVHLIDGEVIGTETWTNDKPYLIINSMLVDSLHTLSLEAGAHLHFERGSHLYVKGNLQVQGTVSEPVIFEGARLDYIYRDVPGQWDGILLLPGSSAAMNYGYIRNAVIGVHCGSLEHTTEQRPKIDLHNCRIEQMTYAGVYALNSEIFSTNTLIANCGFYALALTLGGKYEFFHCTAGNFWQYGARTEPSVVLTNNLIVQQDGQEVVLLSDLEKAYFGNSIIFGTRNNELGIGKSPDAQFNYKFDHCLLKIDAEEMTEDTTDNALFYNTVWAGISDPVFYDPTEPAYNFQPDSTLSIATDKGDMRIVNQFFSLLQYDHNANDRTTDAKPDLGAFEWFSEEKQKKSSATPSKIQVEK